MIRGIIIDDELKSRESLKILLEEFCNNVEVVGLCQNVAEGIDSILKNNPDVIFLDIQMQRETGFDLLIKMEDHITFEIIFTTAHSEYAIKAFKFSAIDYLLKPIDIEDLRKAIKKLEKKRSHDITEKLKNLIKNIKNESLENNKIALPTSDGLVFLNLKDITYCEATSNYTTFHLVNGKKYVVSKTLKEYEDLLTDYNFFRIHNSYLVNLREIKKYIKGDGGHVILSDESTLDVSRRKKDAFLNKISLTD